MLFMVCKIPFHYNFFDPCRKHVICLVVQYSDFTQICHGKPLISQFLAMKVEWS